MRWYPPTNASATNSAASSCACTMPTASSKTWHAAPAAISARWEQSLSGRNQPKSPGFWAKSRSRPNAANRPASPSRPRPCARSPQVLCTKPGSWQAPSTARGEAVAESTQRQIANLSQATQMLEQLERRMGAGLTGAQRGARTAACPGRGTRRRDGKRQQPLHRAGGGFAGECGRQAKQIGAVLADNAQSSSAAISRQFEDIRRNTEGERERTATAIREAYEGVARDMAGCAGGRPQDSSARRRKSCAQ